MKIRPVFMKELGCLPFVPSTQSPWVIKSVRDRSFLQPVCCIIGLGSKLSRTP